MIRTQPVTGQLRALAGTLSLLLWLTPAFGMDREDDRLILESDISVQGSQVHELSITDEKWTFTLSGGMSLFQKGSAQLTTEDTESTFTYLDTEYTLIFPADTYEADDFEDGYSVQGTLTRQMNSWISLGLQSGVSFGHSQTVREDQIPFYSYDSFGNLISVGDLTYTIDYKFITYYAAPLLTVGRYFPVGNFAWKPYVNAGAGISSTQEKVVLNVADVDFDLGKRTTTAVTTLVGGGLDFRISPNGSLGVQYQIQHVSSNEKWKLGLPVLRFSYLF